jgi:hypothetical protein
MNTLCFSLHSQAAKFCHRAAVLLPPQTCSLTTNYHPALHSSPSCPASIPHFPAVVSTPCQAKHPQHHTCPIPRIPSRTQRPRNGVRAALGLRRRLPFLFPGLCKRPRIHAAISGVHIPACFASDLHVSPLAKRVRDPACGSPVGRAGRSVRREESRPRRADSLRFCGTRAQRGLGCIGGNVEHLKTAVWRRRSGQASFW